MIKKYFLAVISLASLLQANAQKEEGRKQVDKLCGCFEVSFKYAETFSPDPNYKYHDREETGGVAELALPIEVSDKKVIIQHLLVVSKDMVVKHWREEWSYENPVIWEYKGDRTWVKKILPAADVKGKWTQTVWEVSDEPRYQGLSQFVNMDGKMTWQSTVDAPLPRREYSVRNDYNVLKRTNRLNITDSGYVHEQDNRKIIRNNGSDQLLVEEKGLNVYVRTSDTGCAAAKEYWEKNREYWTKVRRAWDDIVSKTDTIHLKNKVEGKMLNEYLGMLSRDYADKKIDRKDIDARIKSEIGKFMDNAAGDKALATP